MMGATRQQTTLQELEDVVKKMAEANNQMASDFQNQLGSLASELKEFIISTMKEQSSDKPSGSPALNPDKWIEFKLQEKAKVSHNTQLCREEPPSSSTTVTLLVFINLLLMASFDQAMAKQQSHDGVVAGTKAAGLAAIVTAIPTVAIARMLPWGRANLNYTAQALIIPTVAEQRIL